MRRNERSNGFSERGKVWGDVSDAYIDVRFDHLTMHGLQPMLRLVEIVPHVPGEKQSAVQLECPFVVRAHQFGYLTAGFRAHLGTAMTAGVVEGPNLFVCATDDRDGVVADLQRQVLTRLLQLKCVPCEDPAFVPDLFQILSVNVWIAIKGTWQRVVRFALRD
jgi:hypothetical protein